MEGASTGDASRRTDPARPATAVAPSIDTTASSDERHTSGTCGRIAPWASRTIAESASAAPEPSACDGVVTTHRDACDDADGAAHAPATQTSPVAHAALDSQTGGRQTPSPLHTFGAAQSASPRHTTRRHTNVDTDGSKSSSTGSLQIDPSRQWMLYSHGSPSARQPTQSSTNDAPSGPHAASPSAHSEKILVATEEAFMCGG
jgi:hypothetical protein